MDRFLASVERRAFNMARLAVADRDEALDIVQDAMLALVRRYGQRNPDEWRPLFFSILQNRITDWHRCRRRLSRWQLLRERFSGEKGHHSDHSDIGELPDPHNPGPHAALLTGQQLRAVEEAVASLPVRQQQAFLLRTLEGFGVAETARIMRCSEGSVKTHLSRAMKALRVQLEDYR